MRYVYGITAAILLGGAAATLTLSPVGAQTAQNEPGAIAAAAPRAGAPMSFADLAERLQPAVVNISTRQSVQVQPAAQLPPGFEEFFRRFGGAGARARAGRRRHGHPARRLARLGLHHLGRRLYRHQQPCRRAGAARRGGRADHRHPGRPHRI